MFEIQTFRLKNRTKFSSDFRRSDFRHSGRSVCQIVQLYYKRTKSERSVGRVNQPNVWNLNKMVWISDNLKFELFGNGTTLESAEIRTFGFQILTVSNIMCQPKRDLKRTSFNSLITLPPFIRLGRNFFCIHLGKKSWLKIFFSAEGRLGQKNYDL